MKQFRCAHCGVLTARTTGHVNRSLKLGNNLFCSKACSGLGRRTNKSIAQKKLEKRLYDIEYRAKNFERLKAQKAEYSKIHYRQNLEHYHQYRISRRERHAEYCRRPEYKAQKHRYDRERYGRQRFGEFWESHVLAMDLVEACREKESAYQSRLKNGTLNKALKRGRNGQTKRGYT